MSTDYFSAHASREAAERSAKDLAKKRTRKFVIVGAIAAVAVIPTAAYAIITGIIGTGTISSDAGAAPVNMTVANANGGNQPLYPGSQADVKFTVSNPNPYPVTLQSIEATGFTAGAPCSVADFTTTLPSTGSYTFPSTFSEESLTVPGKVGQSNGTKTITIPNGIKLKSTATASCGYSIPVKVTGQQKAESTS